jgi:hypothetical protein
MEGQLLECPLCKEKGKRQVLGKVLNNGDLLVLRFHHGTTICRSESYSLMCGCGFAYNVSGTVITNTMQHNA